MRFRIAMTVADRIDYLRQVLDSWTKVPGYNAIAWVFRVEPIRTDVIQMVDEFKVPKKVHVNEKVQGALSNPYLALQDAFERDQGADFVILGEDDSIVAPDILEYFVQMAHLYDDDDEVFAVCGFTHEPLNDDETGTFRQDFFASCVWGTWRNRWDTYMRDNWDHTYESNGWDHRFVNIIRSSGLECVFPTISRVQHIGQYGGVHMKPEDYDVLKAQRFLSNPKSNKTKFRGVEL